MNITGPEPAFYGHVWGVQLTLDEVFAYYSAGLARLGWVPDFGPTLSSGELQGWGWCKPRLFFRLAIFDPARYDRVGIQDGTRYRAVIDARINGTDRACPHTPKPFPAVPTTGRP